MFIIVAINNVVVLKKFLSNGGLAFVRIELVESFYLRMGFNEWGPLLVLINGVDLFRE